MATSSNLALLRRRLLWKRILKPLPPPSSSSSSILSRNLLEASNSSTTIPTLSRRFFASSHSGFHNDVSQGPAPIDYSCMLQEDAFHNLADSTIHHLLEKIEEYGDSIDIDGFDIDYGNQVLTVKLGTLGTYVVNKQTPNRQIWMSSPVSGPSRFDWDQNAQAWIYRRNKEHLLTVLQRELEQLCGKPISLS